MWRLPCSEMANTCDLLLSGVSKSEKGVLSHFLGCFGVSRYVVLWRAARRLLMTDSECYRGLACLLDRTDSLHVQLAANQKDADNSPLRRPSTAATQKKGTTRTRSDGRAAISSMGAPRTSRRIAPSGIAQVWQKGVPRPSTALRSA